jgi:hypothetical protein
MGTFEQKGAKLVEIRRKSGSVWGVYDEDGNIVVITSDRHVALTFMKSTKERK